MKALAGHVLDVDYANPAHTPYQAAKGARAAHFRWYGDAEEAFAAIVEPLPKEACVTAGAEVAATNKDRPDWAGARTRQEACEILRRESKRSPARTNVSDLAGGIREPTWRYGVVGGLVHAPRYSAHDAQCMLRRVMRPGRRRHVRLAIDAPVSSYVSPEEIAARGLVIAGAVDALEATGRRVEVVYAMVSASQSTGKDGRVVGGAVTLKAWDAPLELARIVTWLTEPCALRMVGFRLCEMAPWEARQACGTYSGGGYGHPGPAQSATLGLALKAIDDAPTVVVAMQDTFKARQTREAIAEVQRIVESATTLE